MMNIETLLEAAKYVESVGVVASAPEAEHSFTRGKDEVDSGGPKGTSSYTPSILEKQLTGSPPPKRARTKSPGLRYSETQPVLQHPPPASQPVISPSSQVLPTTIANIPVSSSSIIQHAPACYPATNPPVSYHLYTHVPPQHLQQHHVQQQHPQHHVQQQHPQHHVQQQHPQHHVQQQHPQHHVQQQHPQHHVQQQHPQHHLHPSQHPQLLPQHVQQHPSLQALAHHQQAESQQPQRYVTAPMVNPVGTTQPPAPTLTQPPPSQPPPVQPQPLLSPAMSSAVSPRPAGPSQAMDLLKLAESHGSKYTTLSNVTSPRGRVSSPGSHHGNISPRLVHQIVSHNQWVAGERPVSPKQSPNHTKQSGESDSNDSANDGSGKDKRAGIREVHNKLEKNRRAHLKECFENLRTAVPNMEDKKSKTSNLSILRGALRFIQVLSRKERDLEHELDRLVRQKIEAQQRLDLLKIKNGLTIGKPIELPQLPLGGCEEDIQEEDEERLVVVEEKDVDVMVEDKRDEVDDDQASTSTASEAEEEERKSRVQSRSESPLHQPVSSSQLIHPSYSLPGASTSYQQAFASFQGAIKETPPYTNTASRPMGLSRSANEAMLRFTTMRDAQPPQGSDPLRHKQKHPETILSRHGSAPTLAASAIPPQRTTYMQMSQDKVLQSVANQISPMTRMEMPIVVSQSSGALAGSVTRQTVSQLLGKQPVVRQPVRRQLSVSQFPVIQPPLQTPHQLLPRIMTTPSLRLGFNPATQGVLGPGKPVVTVGINSLLAQPSVIQTTSNHKTVISNGSGTMLPDPSSVTFPARHTTPSVITASPLTTPVLTNPLVTSVFGSTTAGAASSTSLMTASVITQTLPVMSHTGHSQFIPPIALQSPATAGASLLFTHPSSYIGLPHTMLPQPFLGSFAATRPSHIQLATSTQVSPSFATTQPLVYPSTQSIDSANLLALAQALPKQMPPGQFPSAMSINSLASQGTLLSTNLSAVKHGSFTTVTSPAISTPPAVKNSMSATPAVKKQKSSASGSSGGKGSRSKHGKGHNGKTEIQITTSKIAETMASLANNSQVIAKNGHSTSTVNSRSNQQQSVVVKL